MRTRLVHALVAGVIPALLIGACGPPPEDSRHASPPAVSPGAGPPGMAGTPEAISLLGEPLHRPVADPATEAERDARIEAAEAAYQAAPGDMDALIWLGRHLAYDSRYRDAIDVFSDGIERHPDDARLYRHRGHRYITVRELDLAVLDLEHAARLVSGLKDEVEPDGLPNPAGIPVSTLHTNIWYHLGLARYLQNELQGAIHAFRTGLRISPNDDMRVAMADWLWHALMRAGQEPQATAVLATIPRAVDLLENDAYHRRLLVYKGELPPGALMPHAEDGVATPLSLATYGYGLGAWHLVRGDTAEARRVYRSVLDTGFWPAFGYIAAEADLARLKP